MTLAPSTSNSSACADRETEVFARISMVMELRLRSRRSPRIIPASGRGFTHRHFLSGAANGGCRKIPVVAAGGIADARGSAAAFALGAEGVQMGTVFLACEESGAHALHREAILRGKAGRTALTRGFTGRLARGIHNELMQAVNKTNTDILPYPLQRVLKFFPSSRRDVKLKKPAA